MHLRHANITGQWLDLYLSENLLLQTEAVVSLFNYFTASPHTIEQRYSK